MLVCGGGTVWGVREPKVEWIESNCQGAENVENKILVAYATKCGSTGEIAQEIGKVLCEAGVSADVQPMKNVRDVSGYQAVVLGSAVRMGQWLSEATRFAETHRQALQALPVACFAVCLEMTKGTEESRRTAESYLDPVREMLHPAADAAFAGVMDYKKLSFLFRLMMRAMKSEEGDYRDWEAIRSWAAGLPEVLLNRT